MQTPARTLTPELALVIRVLWHSGDIPRERLGPVLCLPDVAVDLVLDRHLYPDERPGVRLMRMAQQAWPRGSSEVATKQPQEGAQEPQEGPEPRFDAAGDVSHDAQPVGRGISCIPPPPPPF